MFNNTTTGAADNNNMHARNKIIMEGVFRRFHPQLLLHYDNYATTMVRHVMLVNIIYSHHINICSGRRAACNYWCGHDVNNKINWQYRL